MAHIQEGGRNHKWGFPTWQWSARAMRFPHGIESQKVRRGKGNILH
jgi:hypothetical protein